MLLSSGKAVVTDFGIAKAISASRTMEISTESPITVSATLTSVGSTPGTPAYTAPEQAVGSVVDARTDLYAWGMMAYELLAGAHPFADRTTPQTMVAAQLTERPAPIGEVNPAVPEAFAGIIMRALEKDADDRPASATEVLAAIDGTAPTAPPAAPRVSTRRTSRDVKAVPAAGSATRARHPRRMGVAAALLVFALLVWGVVLSVRQRSATTCRNASAPASPPVAAPETRPDAPLESPRDTRPDRGPGRVWRSPERRSPPQWSPDMPDESFRAATSAATRRGGDRRAPDVVA
ncbi:MAG: protein kinase [Gemmatimonadetes bacterium]|nr:protein kinase [Gemmatimonadota bacterium]